MARVVVIGGGISGLAVAAELVERSAHGREPLDVTCYEAGPVPGGAVQTERSGGFLLESGPIGFRERGPAAEALFRRLGLEARRIAADPASGVHHVYRAGKLRPLPRSARDLLLGDALPPAARLRVLAEPLAAAGEPPRDESIEDFAVRRLGHRAGTLLADALATAVSAGDSRRLSMRSVFPILRSMEAESGSLYRALRTSTGPQEPGAALDDGRGLVSFPDGLAELTDALARSLGRRLRTGVGVCAVTGMGRRGVRVVPEEGAPLDADAVVLTCPAMDAAAVVGDWDPELAEELDGIPAPPVARVYLGYRDGARGSWPAGAGFVVPRDQGLRMLGTQWTSNLFPGRAPAGSRLLTVSFGGARDPEALNLDDAALIATARADLGAAMGLVADPYLTRVVRDRAGLPQYEIGHQERLARIEARLSQQPAVHLSGCSYRSRGPGACLDEAARLADTIVRSLARRPAATPA